MKMKWRYFAGAAVLAVAFLLTRGVPVIPVLLGIAIAALVSRKYSFMV
jgi:hypothetical protein